MKILKNINSFVFENAEYQVEDGRGNKLLIKVNYKEGGYDLVILKKGNADIRKLADEAGKIASDLIERKSGVNFANNN